VLGLPFAFAAHFAPTYLEEALHLYNTHFKPSRYLKEPYALACVNVIAAPTDAAAETLATSFYRLALGLIRNNRQPLQPPVSNMDGLWNEGEQAAVQHMMQYSFVGGGATVQQKLQAFLETTGVNEIMVASHIYDVAAKKKSYEIIAPFFKTTQPIEANQNSVA
ncbi:MAG TPA: hypothetical protein VM010_08405, partial [Chitinophagaceae bacterium]|nr:hypothetical protein [Chitinophagaceae bacterium]